MAATPISAIIVGDKSARRKTPSGEAQRYYEDVVLTYEGDDCLIWPYSRNRAGYGCVGGKTVSRLVCIAVNGEPETKLDAAHSCGNGHLGCVSPRHMSWKTRAENQADRIIHGTDWRGERHRQAKLTKAEVLQIRAMCGQMSQYALARMFRISRQAVCDIHRRKKWAWLQDEEAA